MDGGQRVWAPHPIEGYQLGHIVDVGADTLTVEPLDTKEKVSRCFPPGYCIHLLQYTMLQFGVC